MRQVARHKVLICVESDGHISVHAGPEIDVHIQRVVQSPTRGSEQLADEVTELLVPQRFRYLYGSPPKAREVARPLKASVALAAEDARRLVEELNSVGT